MDEMYMIYNFECLREICKQHNCRYSIDLKVWHSRRAKAITSTRQSTGSYFIDPQMLAGKADFDEIRTQNVTTNEIPPAVVTFLPARYLNSSYNIDNVCRRYFFQIIMHIKQTFCVIEQIIKTVSDRHQKTTLNIFIKSHNKNSLKYDCKSLKSC